jgi:hypothetical protein
VYNKTWVAEADTGHQIMYANVTDGTILEIPSDPTQSEKPVQPAVVFIDGGHDGTPVYMMFGVGSRFYNYGPEHHFQAMAKVNAAGDGIDNLGVQEDGAYYGGPNYTNPFAMEVDNTNGVAHCLLTTPNGNHLAYWNFDGTNFGECYNFYGKDEGSNVPGLSPWEWYANYMDAQTGGADLAISSDGSEIAVTGLHPRRQVDIFLGSLGGEIWPDSWGTGVTEGTVILLYDTLGQRNGTNIPNDDPKPYTDIQISYTSDDVLHVVYDAAYIDVYIDTVGHFPGTDSAADDWWRNHSSACVGDTNASFYDGSTHPKPQLLYWNSSTKNITTLAVSEYPKSGEMFQWFTDAKWDSGGAGNWGKNYDDGIISNFDMVSNKDPQAGEPSLVIVWEEMDAPVTVLADTSFAFGPYYYSFTTDLKMSFLMDGVWSAPVNLTNSPGVGEQTASVYQDIIDNKIHTMYYRDNWPGRDRNLCYTEDYENNFVFWTEGGAHFSVPIRDMDQPQVEVVYQEFDLTPYTGIANRTYLPDEFNLAQNYPNPFNPTTTISYTVPNGKVTLDIYNVLGQKVNTLVNSRQVEGSYDVVWDGTNFSGKSVASGIYFYKLKSVAGVKTKKMLFQK